jgi:hypothetical protein
MATTALARPRQPPGAFKMSGSMQMKGPLRVESAKLPRVAGRHSDIGTPLLPNSSMDQRPVAAGGLVQFRSGRRRMKNKVLYSAIAGTVGLLGCAGENIKAALPCNAGVCKVVVRVTDCMAVNGISVSEPKLYVDKPKESKTIIWEFETNGYFFPPNGIIIGKDPAGELHDLKVAPKGKSVKIENKHQQSNYEIYYSVNVMMDGGISCIPLDPTIFNM